MLDNHQKFLASLVTSVVILFFLVNEVNGLHLYSTILLSLNFTIHPFTLCVLITLLLCHIHTNRTFWSSLFFPIKLKKLGLP